MRQLPGALNSKTAILEFPIQVVALHSPAMPPLQRATPVYLSGTVWTVYALLFAVAIPWYWPENQDAIVAGLPLWAAVSIGASAVISCFTAWLLLKCWPSDAQLDSEGP